MSGCSSRARFLILWRSAELLLEGQGDGVSWAKRSSSCPRFLDPEDGARGVGSFLPVLSVGRELLPRRAEAPEVEVLGVEVVQIGEQVGEKRLK